MNNSTPLSVRARPTMALFNNGFQSRITYVIHKKPGTSMRLLKHDIESWAFEHRIRMKIRLADPMYPNGYAVDRISVFFEHDQDFLALKLKFNV